MKQPMQALLIAPEPEMRDAIHGHRKEITIREGHRAYNLGVAMLCCQIVPWAVLADITSVRHCLAKEVTPAEYKADGFTSRKDMCEQMRRFYPNFSMDSPVTIVRWTNARGFFVDHPEEYSAFHDSVKSIIG
ncbi:MAG: hypothetical protein Q7S09_00140 [bacterium]|nr:hypothetical protein [bacterium]